MVAKPALTPLTTPVAAPTVAMPVALLLQVPPGVASLNVVDAPTHMNAVPVMGEGNGFMVTVAVVLQPVGKV
jgi:hypothetical protein